jgi:hypothetical protein
MIVKASSFFPPKTRTCRDICCRAKEEHPTLKDAYENVLWFEGKWMQRFK